LAPPVRRFRVLFVTSWYPTREKPLEGVFIREHAKTVARYDDVAVLHLAGVGAVPRGSWRLEEERDATLAEGIPTYHLWCRRSPIPKTTSPLLLWAALQGGRRIAADGFMPDVIHAHIHSAAVAATLLGRVLRRPVVITEHSSAFARGLLNPLAILAAKWTFRSARAVLPVSNALRSAIENLGIRARYQVVPNVVDRAVFHAGNGRRPDEPKRILFVGLLIASDIKGVPILLRAAQELKKRRVDWRLRIVGDGVAKRQHQDLASALQLEGNVLFLGLKTKSEVAEEMRQADLLVLPSLWENLPCVLMEAQASGLPVVASRVGGIPEVVVDGTGELVPPGDAPALARAIANVLDRLDTIDRAAIVEASKRYDPTVVGRDLHKIYESVVENRAGS
jgi:glycogen(starch) synthase